MDETLDPISFYEITTYGPLMKDPKSIRFFGLWPSLIIKRSHQDISNESKPLF
jgi:hypothetical protein